MKISKFVAALIAMIVFNFSFDIFVVVNNVPLTALNLVLVIVIVVSLIAFGIICTW